MIRFNHDQIARLAHESFRQACLLMYDNAPAPWADALPAHRTAMLNVVARLAKNPSPAFTAAAAHAAWLKEQTDAGWSFGPFRDTLSMRSPLVVPWSELSPKYRAKQGLVFAIVRHLLHPEGESA